MYNRYIPQPDGSYRRSKVQENAPRRPVEPPVPPTPPAPSAAPPPPPVPEPEIPPPRKEPRGTDRNRPPRHDPPQGENVASFLRRLLPQNFDTGDLMVVILLLLMSENSRDGQNTALLTLVIYLFL